MGVLRPLLPTKHGPLSDSMVAGVPNRFTACLSTVTAFSEVTSVKIRAATTHREASSRYVISLRPRNLGSFISCQSPPSDMYNDDGEGLPFFQGSTDFGLRYPRNRKYCTSPARVARTDDTLVSVRAPVGAINMAWEECCAGSGVAALRHKTGSRSFTYYFVWSLQNDLKQYEQMGTVFGPITKKQFEMLPIGEPPTDLINYFEACVSAWDERIRLNTSESRSSILHQDALLPKLISGEFRPANFIRSVGGRNANEMNVH